MPSISVIIPFYNTENYIERCLDSITKQTLKDIEIILVNDGSTDGSILVAESFQRNYPEIKIINQENKKQGAARNAGMAIATGEYVGFVDSDDWVDIDYYEKLYNAAKKYDSDIALAANVRIGNGKTKKRLYIEEEKFVTSLQDKIDIGKQVTNPCPTNKIYRLSMLKNNSVGWEEGVYCEDKLFTMQAIYYANGIVSVPDVSYYYYRNPNSTVNSKSKKHSQKMREDKNHARLEVLKFLKEKNAQIRDREFWAVTEEKRFLGIPIYTKKESLHTIEHCFLSFIPYKREAV